MGWRKFGNLCWCGSGIKYKKCHESFDEKLSWYKTQGCIIPPRKIIKNQEQIIAIRKCGKINIAVLDFISEQLHIGMSTEQINLLIYEKTFELGGMPSTQWEVMVLVTDDGYEILAY